MKIWGIHKKYPALSWSRNFLGGFIDVGNVCINGDNAAFWTITITTKRWGYICFTLPSIKRFRKKTHYFYVSPNGTPWASTFYWGSDKIQSLRAKVRRINFGHNFNTEENWDKLRVIDEKFSSFYIYDYDVKVYNREYID